MGQSDTVNQAVSRERTRNYIAQIKGSIFFKGLAVAASFFILPIMIRYLGQEQFGVWSTLLSLMSWIVLFDLGIGNGLRNKISELMAKDEFDAAASYISSGYSLIGILSLALFVIVAIGTFFVPWQKVFNTRTVSETVLTYTILAASFFIFLNFWLSLINQVLNAVQKTSIVVFGQFLSNALALVVVFILAKTTSPSLLYLSIAYGASLITSSVTLSCWFYIRRKELMPRLSLNVLHIRPLLYVGVQFFIIQIAVIVIFTTDKILITQLFSPSLVTQYEVVFKLFSIITLIHSLITSPLWSSYTDSYVRRDFVWIKKILRFQFIIFALIIVAVILLVMMTKSIISIWIGNSIGVSMPLIISMGAFVIISTWNNIFSFFVNGIGKIKPQLYSSVIAMLLNIPLAILLTKYFGFGVNGIVWSTCISLSFFAFLGPIQTYYLLTRESLKDH